MGSEIRKVVIDSTELFGSPLMQSAEWRELLSRARREQLEILVPEIVLKETARKYSNELDKSTRELRRQLGRARALGFSVEEVGDLESEISALDAGYIAAVKGTITASGGEILPIPDVAHIDLIERDLGGRQPFSSNGRGYRDALIWESIVAHAHDAPFGTGRYVLVTGNTDDFTSGGALAGDLAEEFRQRTHGEEIEHRASIGDLLRELRQEFAGDDEALRMLATTEPRQALTELLAATLATAAEQLVGADVADSEMYGMRAGSGLTIEGLPSQVDDITVTSVDADPLTVDYSVYDRYEGETLGLNASIEADIEFDGFAYKGDYPVLDDDVDVLDSDWNDHTMLVGFLARVRLGFNVLVVGEAVENVELDSGEVLR